MVKLQFFAGFTVEETAKTLGVSPRTVEADWRYARAWLYRRLDDGGPSGRDGASDDSGRLATGLGGVSQ